MILSNEHHNTKEEPLCPVFGECGGCAYQNISYKEELMIKEQYLKSLICKEIDLEEDVFEPIIASPQPYYYRHRLDLKVFRSKLDGVQIGFSPQKRYKVVQIERCFIARKEIADYIPQLKKDILARLPDDYRNANIVVRTGDDGRILWGGIGRHSLRLKEEDYLWTDIGGRKVFYSLDTFFQANLFIIPKLFDRLKIFPFIDQQTVLYDLYGGVGLFTMGLFDCVKHSFLIEENPASINLAKYNVSMHQIKNVTIIEGRVEVRLEEILEEDKSFSKVAIIDPPRAGLSDSVREYLISIKQFKNILYLSCNPESLVRDLKRFIQSGWEIGSITPFDFFPRTKHLETLVWLKCNI